MMLELQHIDRGLHDRVVAQVASAFASATAEDKPYCHAFVHDNVFPEDIYARMLQKLPLISVLESLADHSRKNSESQHPLRVRLANPALTRLPPDQSRFWRTIRIALGSPEIREAVFQKLQAGLAGRFHSKKGREGLNAITELICERDGSPIAPTAGEPESIICMQFALVRAPDQMHLGTEFYERSWSPLTWLRPPRGFNIVSSAPFLPYSAFALVVHNRLGRHSWHGRSLSSTMPGARFSLMTSWRPAVANGDTETLEGGQTVSPGELDQMRRGD